MTTDAIYLVVAGEYSDRVVCAYAKESLARKHAVEAEKQAARKVVDDEARRWDPEMQIDTTYRVETSAMRWRLP